jgi:PAS domain S-box-containing protein
MTQPESKALMGSHQPPENILVVDDVVEVLELCAELIRNLGLKASTAPDFFEARSLLTKDAFSLVISDIAMPGMDGLHLTRFIKEHYPGTDIILMTAFSMRYSYDDVLAAGAIDFIQKPFSRDEFEAKIKRVLRERQQFRKVRLSEQRFRTLLENIPGVVFTLLPDGRMRFVDDKISELTGYPAEVLNNNPEIWDSFTSDGGGSITLDALQHASQSRGSLVRQYPIRTHSGQRRWVELRSQAVLDENGQLEHVSGILLDVTHQKHLEDRTSALNSLFLSLGTDHSANIRMILLEVSRLLNASCSLYYHTGGGENEASLTLAHADGRLEEEKSDGVQCGPLLSKIMATSSEQPLPLARLNNDSDLKRDPLVERHQWQTCLGKPLVVNGQVCGAFGVAFRSPQEIVPDDLAVFSMLAKALEIEEERRELQLALIRSEDKYRSLVDGNLYPISIIDGQGVIRYCNKVMASMFQFSLPSALLDRDFVELFHPADRQRLVGLIKSLNRHPGVQSGQILDFRGLAQNGNIMDIRIKVGTISYGGRPALQAILEDVTERKQTEQALKDSEERYRTLVEGANDAVFLETFDGHIVDVNTKACEMLGYSRDELLALAMTDLVSAHRKSLTGKAKQPAEQNPHLEETMVRKDGSRVPVEVNTAILKLKGDKYLMSVVRDITLRKEKELQQRHLEQAILESKQRLMAVFDGIMSPLTITDLDYNIIMVNKATASLFGETIQHLIGRKCYEAFNKASEPCQNCPVTETIRSGKPSHHVGTNALINRTIEEYTYPIYDSSGNLSLVINYGIDVTDKIKMQKQLLQADKMASLGTLAAGIAHEIRNPMATINLNTQILLRDLELSQEHQVYMLDIQKEVKKIERIISEILEFSKPRPAHLIETAINEVVQSVHDLTRVQLRKYGIKVHLDLDDSLPPVLIDTAQISQVVINLVINAMQAMSEGGDLTISTFKAPKSGRVTLSVTDTGVGIPQENIDKIFDPFFTNKPEGTGLGLAIARQLLEKNQATIQLESKVGEGTTFSIQFKTMEAGAIVNGAKGRGGVAHGADR